MGVCTSCNHELAPGEVAARFPCPECGAYEIWRCVRCRRLSNTYSCPNCGFTGP